MKKIILVSIVGIAIIAALGLFYNQSLLFVALFGLMILMHGFGHGGHNRASRSSQDDSPRTQGFVEEEDANHK